MRCHLRHFCSRTGLHAEARHGTTRVLTEFCSHLYENQHALQLCVRGAHDSKRSRSTHCCSHCAQCCLEQALSTAITMYGISLSWVRALPVAPGVPIVVLAAGSVTSSGARKELLSDCSEPESPGLASLPRLQELGWLHGQRAVCHLTSMNTVRLPLCKTTASFERPNPLTGISTLALALRQRSPAFPSVHGAATAAAALSHGGLQERQGER